MIVTINAVVSAGSPTPNPSTFVLAPGGISSPSGFSIHTERNTQVRQALRATAARDSDRGNLQTNVTFSVTRYFATVQLAESYILTHASTIPGGGTVVFQTVGNTNFYLTNAVVKTTDSKHTGRTTLHSYSISGGLISSKNISQ
jgi:hypothetical protein